MEKAPTGIAGFDEVTRGGLPRNRTTLIEGSAGAGKTVFALQTLVHGARNLNEPGIFVAFEESSRRIVANAEAFGWDLPDLERKRLFLLDAQPCADHVVSGEFDLAGMLAAVQSKADAMGARRIVFDALDIVLGLVKDVASVRREAYRLHGWLLERELTGLITAKQPDGIRADRREVLSLGFMQFMVDCTVRLRHDLVDGVAQRRLQVKKFRGSGFSANAAPFVFGEHGFEVAYAPPAGITRTHGHRRTPYQRRGRIGPYAGRRVFPGRLVHFYSGVDTGRTVFVHALTFSEMAAIFQPQITVYV